MRRIRMSVAMSLDGYLAGPNGESDWIVMDPEIDFAALMSGFDTLFMGRRTYEASRGQGGGAMPGMRVFVFSRSLRQEDCPGVTVSDDPAAVVADLRGVDGRDAWLFGGGVLLRSFLDLRLLDALEVAVIPVLLGDGIPLLPGPAESTKLRLERHRVYSKTGTVSLEYAPAWKASVSR